MTVAAMAVAVYWPTLNNDLVNWDDFDYLTKNDYVAERGGLSRIWDRHEKHEQFYPMVFTSFWLEHKFTLWLRGETAKDSYEGVFHLDRGFEPWIHHLTNMLLHAACAALVVWLLRLLGVSPWVAWLTAALFAVHPINVASVAWTAERKNVLSGVFYLLSLICYLRDTRRRSWISYGLCVLLFGSALLSKSAMMTMSATAILGDRLIERRWSWRSWVRVAPMLALGAVSAYVTKTTEVANAGATMVPLEPILRPLAAAGALWFYVGKLLVPYHFPGVYSRWDLQGSWPVFKAALVGLFLAGWIVWMQRRRIPGHALWGLGHFVVSLSPMLGLLAFNYTQFSFVADHFVYLSSVGVLLCVVLAADSARRRLGTGWAGSALPTALAGLVLAALGTASFVHGKTVWKDGETFWVYTLERNPQCWPGHYNLANIYKRRANALVRQQNEARRQARQASDEPEKERLLTEMEECQRQADELLEKAAAGYRRAAQAKPDLVQAHSARGDTLGLLKRFDEALAEHQTAVKIRPRNVRYRFNLGNMLARLDRLEEAKEHFRTIIRYDFRQNEVQRRYLVDAHVRLGGLLHRERRLDEAVRLYEGALEIDPDHQGARRALKAARKVKEHLATQPAGE